MFTLATLLYAGALAYHVYYNVQCFLQHKATDPRMKAIKEEVNDFNKISYLILSLIPSVLTVLYGLTLAFASGSAKSAGFFQLCSMFYIGVIS